MRAASPMLLFPSPILAPSCPRTAGAFHLASQGARVPLALLAAALGQRGGRSSRGGARHFLEEGK